MRPYLLLIAFLSISAFSDAQDFSNKGKEFWLGYGNHQQMTFPTSSSWPGMDIYVTSDVNTTVTVDIPGLGISLGTHNVVANQITTIRNVPPEAFLDQEGISNNGIHIVAGRPVVVYAFIYFSSVSGATLCLPVSTLGREYYSVNYTQRAQAGPTDQTSYSYFFVVATEDNTTIEVTPTANAVSNSMVAGQTYTRVLNRGQVFNMLSRTDLTGSLIRSVNSGSGCKKIAVYCGSGKIGIGCGTNTVSSSDNLFQQMYPNWTWGKKYLTTPSATRPLNYYRIIRPDPGTQVKLDGQLIPAASFTNNFYYEFSDGVPHMIEGDKPILVAQYFTTSACAENTNNGDPEMIFLNPVEQTIRKVTLTSMTLANPNNVAHFINVVVKNTSAAINSFQLDGVGYASDFVPHTADANYAYARIKVKEGTHTMYCDSAFNAIAYGFAQTESYGYSAGTNLKDLYQFMSVQNEAATINFPASCTNSPFRLAITFPYQPSQIKWIFGTTLNALGFRDTTINNPVYDSTWVVDGKTLYQYRLAKTYQLSAQDIYTIRINATDPSSNACNGEQENEYYLEIFERPKAGATVTNTGCLTDEVLFKDQSEGRGRSLLGWYWNMDDNTAVRTEKDVQYKYATAGTYDVLHAVSSDIGCMSDTIPLPVSISAPPVAAFTMVSSACEDKAVNFRPQPGSGPDPITQWTWNFGDGSAPLSASNSNDVSHTYTSTGTYTVSLQVSAASGCKSVLKELPVTIHPNPVVDFEIPEVCADDPFAAFTDKSTIADNSEAGFSWQWNFGDRGSAAVANPQHKYATAGNYTVQLTVTSNNNCGVTLGKPVTVNGAVQRAAFTIDNATALCAGQDVTIHDASAVDFGNLTKVVIYWDYDADPANKTEDDDAALGKTYSYKYPAFNTPPDREYRIVYEAWSGTTCFKSQEQRVTIKPSPQLVFDPLTPVCEDVTPFRITTARALSPANGTGTFSGDGVDADGLFNPGRAGDGLHTIIYSFTGDNGCTASIPQDITVYPTPLADAGPDKGLLSGGSVTLEGKGEGNQLTILWSPVTSMQGFTTLTPVVSPVEDIRYTLMVTSAEGCKAQDEVLVKVMKKPVIPNAFSPNGDGINDKWIILYLDSYPGCTVDIFNRYGQRVFRSTGYGTPWDGTMNGNALPVGTYYWIVNPRNGRPVEKGAVTIIR